MGINTKGYSIRDRSFGQLSLVWAGLVFVFAAMYSVQPCPFFTEQFHISVSVASLSVSMTTLSVILGLIVLGFIRSLWKSFVHSFIHSFYCHTFFFMPLTDSFSTIILLRFIQGFAIAGVPAAAALAYLSEEIDQQSMGFATALYISCNALGGTIGRLMMGYVTEYFHGKWHLFH